MTQHITQEQVKFLVDKFALPVGLGKPYWYAIFNDVIQHYIDSIDTSRERVEKDAGNVQVAQLQSLRFDSDCTVNGVEVKAETVYQVAQPASEVSAPEFMRVARTKLDSLLSEGYKINGYSIERNDTEGTTRGFVTAGGLVGWWTPESEPAAVSGWMPIENAPKVKRTNKPWDESDRVVVRVEHNRMVYAAFGRYIHSHATGYEWLIEGHSGDWSNRVTGWLPLPAAPTGEPG